MFRAGLAFAFFKHWCALLLAAFQSSCNYHNRKSMKNHLSWQRFYKIQFRQIIFYAKANFKREHWSNQGKTSLGPPISPFSTGSTEKDHYNTPVCFLFLYFLCYSRNIINMGTLTEVILHMYCLRSKKGDKTRWAEKQTHKDPKDQ